MRSRARHVYVHENAGSLLLLLLVETLNAFFRSLALSFKRKRIAYQKSRVVFIANKMADKVAQWLV